MKRLLESFAWSPARIRNLDYKTPINVNLTNGLLGGWRVAPPSQKPDFACATRTQNRAIEFTSIIFCEILAEQAFRRKYKLVFHTGLGMTCALALSLLSSVSISAKVQATPIPPNAVLTDYTPPPPPDRSAPGHRGEGASRGPSPQYSITYAPPPLPNRGAPGHRSEGASRGLSCTASPTTGTASDRPSLTALAPEQASSNTTDTPPVTQVWGLTSTAHPRFWFSLPYDSTDISSIEFVLQNAQDQIVYHTAISALSTPGILSVPIPSTVNGLEINQPYHWFFTVSVACEPNHPPTLTYVEGWIQRIPLTQELSDRLTQSTPPQQAALYAGNGLWYDALTTLANLKLTQPGDGSIAHEWIDLLTSVGLADLAAQPLIQEH